jgi:hypothetical protein
VFFTCRCGDAGPHHFLVDVGSGFSSAVAFDGGLSYEDPSVGAWVLDFTDAWKQRRHCAVRSATCRTGRTSRGPAFSCLTLASSHLDGCGANSSIAIVPSCLPSRIRETSCVFALGILPRRDFRCHPSCDNRCGLCRRLGPERWLLEVWGRP